MRLEDVEDIYPLTPLQRGMLFHSVLAPESGDYVAQLTCTITGPLERAAFEGAWHDALRRHSALRTAFVWEGVDEPVQAVLRDVAPPLAWEDWRDDDEPAREARLERWLGEDRARGFALTAAPLLRLHLARTGDRTWLLTFTSHHVLLDGWSLPVLFEDVFASYRRRLADHAGSAAATVAPAAPFRDYVAWLEGLDRGAAETCWRARLARFAEPTPLPAARAEGSPPSSGWCEERLRLSRTETAGLQRFARENGLTANTLVQGAWALLCTRWTGARDVVFGVTLSGRPPELPGVESMVGLFVNTLPLRVAVPRDARVVDWLREVQARTGELAEHAWTPLVDLRTWTDLDASAPLFESLVVFESYPLREGALAPGAALSVADVRVNERTHYPLNLVAFPGERLELRAIADLARVEGRLVPRLLLGVRELLAALARDPRARLDDLEAGTDREELAAFASGGPPRVGPATVPDLFAARAARTPDAPAVEGPHETLDYGALAARANRIARHLATRGVGRGSLVAICLERSCDLIASELGVLAAGGAFLPLDPGYPPARLAHLSRDARPDVLVTSTVLLPRVEAAPETVVLLDDGAEAAEIAAQDPTRPAAEITPDDLAYVLYTSGSTGRPKGVEVCHRGVGDMAAALGRPCAVGTGSRFLQFASIGYDASVHETFTALLSGATLVLARPEELVPGEPLQRTLARRAVTTATLPPSVLRELDPAGLPALTGVTSAGEACPPELARRLAVGRRFVNAYGPTETTVLATLEEDGTPPPCIGRPTPGLSAHVLDDRLRPSPVGAAGELFLGGSALARGYRGRPALTAERFVPDPFGDEPGARLYATGDRARWRPDGRLEFLGRVDAQLKVRGVRIEPGEVEAALLAHAGVGRAAVDARRLDDGPPALCAWVVAAADRVAPAAAELRAFLAERLPPALVPSRFVAVERLPLTPHGKLDRRALATPPATISGDAVEAVDAPPATPLEAEIAACAARVLGRAQVARHADFFDLGGHSLQAMQLVARLREELDVDLPLAAMFEAPTPALLARRVEELRSAPEGDGAGRLPALAPVATDAPLPLSFAQQRLWFLDRLERGSPLYLVPLPLRIEARGGRLDVEALERALRRIVARQPALRTRFEEHDGEPRQVVLDDVDFELRREDIGPLPGSGRRARARERVEAEARRPFELDRAPLVRATLFAVEPGEHHLVIVFHHVVADGLSIGVFARELAALYAEEAGGARAALAPVQVGPADAAVWERDPRVAALHERELAFWHRELDGAPQELELPVDTPRAAGRSGRGTTVGLAVDGPLARSVRSLARHAEATPFMVLLAVCQAWLARLSGQRDLLVGTPVAGRRHAALEPAIGNFVNTLALRAELGDDPPFEVALERARARTLAALAHQDVPFERVVEALVDRRDRARAPLVQALFVFEDLGLPQLALPGLAVEPLEVDVGVAKFDLLLAVDESADGWLLSLEVDADLFDRATAERWLAAYRALLAAAVTAPGTRVGDLDWIAPEERERLAAWERAPSTHPRELTIDGAFAAQVARTPEAVAVVARDAELTYRELDRRADRLAHRLRRLGVGPDVVVGVAAERSIAFLVAVLGTLKAGGAYLPLDPAYPEERLRLMLDATRARALVTQPRFADALGDCAPAVIVLDDGAGELTEESDGSLPPTAAPANLAYVIFTSGSTGTPKGVGVSHRAVVRLVLGEPFVELGPDEVVLQFVSSSFDVSTFEIWGPLLTGARLAVFPPHAPTLSELGAFVRARGVTTMWLTAGLFHQMVDERVEDLSGVRRLLAGGEALSPAHVERALQHLPDTRLTNGYGPTEVTTFTTTCELRPDLVRAAGVPIGRPINGTRVHVLDARLRRVPPGVWGELWAAGDGLARGYVGDPRLTAERFLPDPFGGEPGERMYRIGDRARWRGDGLLEFGGRVDRQVKLRGFRVEPGEIEAVLGAHADVGACAVELREVDGDPRLVAWVVPAAREREGAPDERALRAHLADRLPDFMVPAHFVALEALPLTANGKVDRRALPDPVRPETSGADADASRAAVEGSAAELVAQRFAAVLALDAVGPDDDFFELGGHSLLATRLVARLRDLFGRDVPLAAVFEHSTPASLADAVVRGGRGAEDDAGEPIRARQTADAPLSPAQERLWFLDRYAPGSAAYHTPLTLELEGPLDVGALRAALEDVVRRHAALRTTYPDCQGIPVARVGAEPRFDLAVEDAAHAEEGVGARVAAAGADLARRPFDLVRGPLLRAHLLRLDAARQVLHLCLHHVACDGWSLAILAEDLSTAYRARAAGETPAFAALPIQYGDWAAWQRERWTPERRERERAWWAAELSGSTERLALAAGAPAASAAGGRRGEGVAVTVPAELTRALEALARREGVTLFMLLLAVFQALLGRLAGRERFVVGSPIAGRERRETEGLVGLFVNLLALRADLRGNPRFRALLARVRDVVLAASAHGELPVEELADLLREDGDPRGGELFQATFTLHNTPRPRLDLGPVSARRCDLDAGAAYGELWLSIEPRADGGLEAFWQFDADLLDGALVECAADAFLRFLGTAPTDPDVRLDALPLLGPGDAGELERLGRGAGVYGADRIPCELFARAVDRAPDSVAVACAGEALTYRELEDRTGRLARHLRALGVGPDVRVAVACERSLELVIGLLGVWRAGGAYVPLDPTWPTDRIATLLADCGAPVLLTLEALADELPAGVPWVLALDEDEELFADGESALPAVPAGPGNLAYVTYTSGSTGRPKAVGVPLAAVTRLVAPLAEDPGAYAPLGPDDVVLGFASTAFDASTFEIWGALCSGARLELAPPGAPSLAELGTLVRERGVTAMWLTAGLFNQMVDERVDDLRGVRRLLAGGEALSPAHVARALAALPDTALVNGYGPTECTTFTACHHLRPEDGAGPSVPVGRPVPGTRVLVLDRELRPVPPGAFGELCVGGLCSAGRSAGSGLARGYVNDPRLTASRFVPDPTGGAPGERLYRTGDRVRWRADGTLEFAGRLDRQLKLRGYRIEPGEVEAALGAHPSVRAAAVDVVSLAADRRLVAWVAGDALPRPRELAAFLRVRLPEAWIPSHFVALAELPLTENGKLDRRALPAVDLGDGGHDGPGDGLAAGPVEELLAAAWSELLGRATVGRDDDFFDLGGHSLLATQLVARVRELFEVELPLHAVFEAPTVAGLAAVVADARAQGTDDDEQLVARARAGDLPLSFAQQRLWFLERLDPGRPTYHVPFALELDGELDVEALRGALAHVVARHETLRTRFPDADGVPRQEVDPPGAVDVPVSDLAALDRGAREAAFLEHRDRIVRAPFDLARGPLLRAELVRTGERRHVLLFCLHHIVSDGWSLHVLARELSEAYTSLSARAEPGLDPLPIQYADFARWQRRHLAGERLERELAWWRAELADATLALEVGRGARETDAPGLRVEVTLLPAVVGRMESLARREGATLFMLLLAGFQALLARLTGADDFVVGAPIANRRRRATEDLVGFFVNTLALRADLGGRPSFRDLLARVRRTTLRAYEHQDLPFERLMEELGGANGERSAAPAGRTGLPILFALQNAPPARFALGDLEVRPRELETGAAHADLVFAAQKEADCSLVVSVEADASLFDGETAERLAASYVRLLEGALEAPCLAVDELPLLAPEEAAAQLAHLRGPDTVYPRDAGLVELFDEWVHRSPNAPAVEAAGRKTTYAELGRRSRALARALAAHGVGAEEPIGLCTARADRLALGMLGVLRASGAYLPIDPLTIGERTRTILADAGARIVLAAPEVGARLAGFGVTVLDLETVDAPAEDEGLAPAPGAAARLAYVMYTSGSTGRPKGVAIVQRSVARLVLGTDYLELGPGGRVACAANPAFDANTFEVWSALLNGATLVDVEREAALAPGVLAGALRTGGISHLVLTTAVFQAVAGERPDAFASLAALHVGGERLSPDAVRAVLAAGAPGRLVNVYGPTEAATFAATYTVSAVAAGATDVPIGHSTLAGTDLLVVDDELNPVPPGFPGELCIAGDAIARGYLGRGALTAASFVPHPASDEPGARLYRTGDLVRQDEQGELVFLARRDAQLKLRGMRLEPGEVEAAVTGHALVRAAAVDVRGGPGGERLVAWIVPEEPGRAPSAAALAEHVAALLPGPMRPRAFVAVDDLPLTRNGKLDRAALSDPRPEDELTASPDGRPRAAPEGALEELVAATFAEVLGEGEVSAEDDFFALGGHSLVAARVAARLARALGREVALRALFEAPTVRGLAARLAGEAGDAEGRPSSGSRVEAIEVLPGPREGPLSFAQERVWFLQRLQPESPFYNVPVALRLEGPLDARAWERAMRGVTARHEALRTRIEVADGRPVQAVDPVAAMEVERLDLAHLPRQEAEAAVRGRFEELAREPFDLAAGPLWRAALARVAPDEHVALFVVHHVVADGASLAILVREISAAYPRSDGVPPLPPPTIQPLDLARHARGTAAADARERGLAWWTEALAGLPPALDLPTDRPRPAVQGFRGATVPIELDAGLARGLAELARHEGTTLFVVLLAGFQALLARWTGARDFAVGTVADGRDRLELEGLFGFLVDTLVLRVDLSGRPGFGTLVRRTRARVLDAFEHRDVPFEAVVEAVAPVRDTSRSPLFQVAFALQDSFLEPRTVAGLDVRAEELETRTAKFDLTLALRNGPDGLSGELEYDADLFERDTVARLAANLIELLRAALADPARPVARLDWIAAEERHALAEFARAAEPPPPEREPVHRLVERWARRTPTALAVRDQREALTYAELDGRATVLARRLRTLGIGPEECVALHLDRSVAFVVGALATLKAGGAYLPLDRTHPPERTRGMLVDARVRVVLTDERCAEGLPLPDAEPPAVVLVGETGPTSPARREAPVDGALEVEVTPAQPAYVVFTSGSTGRPKGVEVPHAGLANLVGWHVSAYGVTPGDRAPLVAGTAFDASVWELWPYLAAGASLHVVPPEVRIDPPLLVDWLVREEITLAFLPTPLAEAVVGQTWPAKVPLRALLTGGDRLHAPPPAGLPFALVNHYGPTESSVVASACAVPPAAANGRSVPGIGTTGAPPIGVPIPGVRALVLDAELAPVPIGAAGELYLGGASLARGYRGQPKLTAAAFVPDPSGNGLRLYRTGDRVRWRRDGALEFLGRLDAQVKVRGQRVELGEVESLLASRPDVAEAAVAPHADGMRLVAYVVSTMGEPDPAALARDLRERLPEYMVPTDWIALDALPKSSSGKVDRRALPAPERSLAAPRAKPETELERALAAIWAGVLELREVDVETNFFDLGGHSLALLEVQARLSAELGQEVAVVELFQHPTVRALARWLEGSVLQPRPAEGRARGERRAARRGRRRQRR